MKVQNEMRDRSQDLLILELLFINFTVITYHIFSLTVT